MRANFLREPSGTDHARSARIRVLAIDHKDQQARLERFDAGHRVGQRQLFGVAIENGAAETLGAATLCEQQCPGGRLDRGKGQRQILISLCRRTRIDEEDVEGALAGCGESGAGHDRYHLGVGAGVLGSVRRPASDVGAQCAAGVAMRRSRPPTRDSQVLPCGVGTGSVCESSLLAANRIDSSLK